MNRERWIRIALGYLALSGIQIGAWALFAPQSFYDGFPGLGRGWISVDGPYNEHLIRDVGALNLALAAVLVLAAVRMERTLVQTAAVAALIWGVPHFIYHLFNSDALDAADQFALVGGLGLSAAIPVAILIMTNQMTSSSTDGSEKVSQPV